MRFAPGGGSKGPPPFRMRGPGMTASPSPTVLLDACVLFGPPLRGVLVGLARAGLFRAGWTDDVDRECKAALRRHSRCAIDLDRALPDGRIDGYAHLVPTLTLPDPDDRHVLAAAIAVGADAIVTWNRRDFPAAALRPHGIAAVDPDSFILHLLARDRAAVLDALPRHGATLRAERLFRTVKALTPWIDQP